MRTILVGVLCFLLTSAAYSQPIDTIFRPSVKEIMALPVMEKEEETVTTASKKTESAIAAPATMTVITAKEIEAFGALNLGEILDRVTSMYFTGGAFTPQGTMIVRGTISTTQLLHLLDGRPLREYHSMAFNQNIYTAFPIQIIEKWKLLEGQVQCCMARMRIQA